MNNEVYQILLSCGKITANQLNICMEQYRQLRSLGIETSVEDIMVYNKFVNRTDIEIATKKARNILTVKLPESVRQKYCFKLHSINNGVAQVYAARYISAEEKSRLMADLQKAGLEINDIVCLPIDSSSILQDIRTTSYPERENLSKNIQALSRDPSNGQLLQQVIKGLLIDAIEENASDIHLYKSHSSSISCYVSYRVDGVLRYKYQFAIEPMMSLFVRLKTEAGMDISEGRKPQDGKIKFRHRNVDIDIRASAMPTHDGESLVLRILNPESLKSYKELYSNFPHICEEFEHIINAKIKTGGLIMITGATGSGKTTTMYGLIKDIDRYGKSVLTIEDPVEYTMPGVKQVNVNEYVGLTFSNILKYQVRHDPDVLVVGELRDSETAEHVLRAVESGHLVITTLHAIDVRQAINRLINMLPHHYRESGAFVAANYTRAVVNQKLVRMLCPNCSMSIRVDKLLSLDRSHESIYRTVFDMLGISYNENVCIPNPAGCNSCNGIGLKGRTVVIESIFFPFNKELQAKMQVLMSTAAANNQLLSIESMVSFNGVKYYSLSDSVKTLLLMGIIDPMTAISVLDIGPTDTVGGSQDG